MEWVGGCAGGAVRLEDAHLELVTWRAAVGDEGQLGADALPWPDYQALDSCLYRIEDLHLGRADGAHADALVAAGMPLRGEARSEVDQDPAPAEERDRWLSDHEIGDQPAARGEWSG
jgi:hypothetical protein